MTFSELQGVDEADHLLLSCSIASTGHVKTRAAVAIIDSGATANFVSKKFVKTHDLPLIKLPTQRRVKLANLQALVKAIKYFTKFEMVVNHYYETVKCFVLEQVNHDIILGTTWLRLHSPDIDWVNNSVTFLPERCTHCLSCRQKMTA